MSNIINLVSEDVFSQKMDAQNALLAAIAANTGSPAVNSWADVQALVRAGLAGQVFSVGDQLVCERNGEALVWDIIGIDCDTPTDPAFTHSLTLQTHALHFKRAFSGSGANESNEWVNENDTTNNSLRHWLNSAETGGFINGLDEDFCAVIGAVNKVTAENSGNSVTAGVSSDKFFILSQTELFGTANLGIAEGARYPYYRSADDVRKYFTDSANGTHLYFTRSKGTDSSADTVFSATKIKLVRVAQKDTYAQAAHFASGIAPACCVI